MSSPPWDNMTISEVRDDETEKAKERFAKENHSEIERRRRSKMNQFIDQLANLIPDCNNPSNKPDKLSILKFAATHCESKKESLSGKIQREIHIPLARSGNLKSLIIFCYEYALVANQKQEGARNHTSDEPALVSLNRFNHILNDSTYGCCFIIEQNELRIIKTNSTIFNCLGLTEYQVKDRCFIDFIHPDDKQLVKDMLCASAHYSRRMLDLKSFQVREESYLPSKCNAGQNERRDFITRIRRHHPTHDRGCINPAINLDYIVVSVCSTIIDNLEPITDQPCWALFVRQEQPEIYTIPHQQCTVKIRLDGALLFCDSFFADILNVQRSEIRKLLGQKIWEILIPPGDDQEELVNVIKDGKRNRVRIKTKINKNVLMDIRPVINPHSKLPEFIIGHLTEVHEYHQ